MEYGSIKLNNVRRPIRHAYFLREGDHQRHVMAFARAQREATS
jgi:hypothetical protein